MCRLFDLVLDSDCWKIFVGFTGYYYYYAIWKVLILLRRIYDSFDDNMVKGRIYLVALGHSTVTEPRCGDVTDRQGPESKRFLTTAAVGIPPTGTGDLFLTHSSWITTFHDVLSCLFLLFNVPRVVITDLITSGGTTRRVHFGFEVFSTMSP